MKKINIIYWISTGFIFLFEGVMPAFTSQSEMAKQGITGLGYPLYFGSMLAIFKVLGALTLILPMIKSRLKEWAYAGFTFNLISAAVSNAVVYGFGFAPLLPVIVLAILAVSYVCFRKRLSYRETKVIRQPSFAM